jgi:hypothetical protein
MIVRAGQDYLELTVTDHATGPHDAGEMSGPFGVAPGPFISPASCLVLDRFSDVERLQFLYRSSWQEISWLRK